MLGHEFVGVVADWARAGERVVLDPAIACGRCGPCLDGDEHLCLACSFAGHSVDGALRSLVAWPERLAHPVPERLTDPEASLLEPLGVALHALDLAGDLGPGASAGVYGCGPLGLLLVQLLRRAGLETVVATDPLRHRADAARAFGATAAYEARRAGVEILPASLRRTGVDVAFEVAGDDEAVATALDTLRPGSRLVVVGIPSDDRVAFTASTARRKGLTIAFCRRMKPSDLPRAVDLAARGGVDLGGLVGDRYPLDRAQEAFAAAVERGGLKVVVEPQQLEEARR